MALSKDHLQPRKLRLQLNPDVFLIDEAKFLNSLGPKLEEVVSIKNDMTFSIGQCP